MARLCKPVGAGVLVVGLGLLSLTLAPAAHAAGGVPALCSFKVHDSPSPGWLITPSKGTSHGTGTITCAGTLDGKQLAGTPGPFTWDYSYDSSDVPMGGNTCALAGAHGTWEVKLPTMDGATLTLTGPWTWMGTFPGEFQGQFGGHPVDGLYETAYPEPNHLNQDCITNPAGDAELIGQASVR